MKAFTSDKWHMYRFDCRCLSAKLKAINNNISFHQMLVAQSLWLGNNTLTSKIGVSIPLLPEERKQNRTLLNCMYWFFIIYTSSICRVEGDIQSRICSCLLKTKMFFTVAPVYMIAFSHIFCVKLDIFDLMDTK